MFCCDDDVDVSHDTVANLRFIISKKAETQRKLTS